MLGIMRLHCNKSFPMMRRLFDAVVKPTVSYGCEVWGTLCSGSLQPGRVEGYDRLAGCLFPSDFEAQKEHLPTCDLC